MGKSVNEGKVAQSGDSLPLETDPRSDANSQTTVGEALPRSVRRKRRSKADRGLPAGGEIANLARSYLERQRKLWPELIGVLPEPTDDVIAEMTADYIGRHRGASPHPKSIRDAVASGVKRGGSYCRISCDKNNPLSIIDQLTNILEKAKVEKRFVPWGYVYADFAVTGMDAMRQGYQSYMAVLKDKDHFIETTYIDDFTRASRDEIEWWKIASSSKRLRKRMIGASDGFDLNSDHWETMIGIYGLLSRLFRKGLKEKVRRGMRGAASRGTSVGRPSLGFTRRQKLGADGTPVTGRDGKPIHERCIDEATAPFRLMAFELYVLRGWTVDRIARHFNELKVDGWEGWTAKSIYKLLYSPSAIGIFIWNMKRTEYNFEEEKYEIILNPPSEWEVYINRDLAIVPLDLWKKARRKLGATRRAHPNTGKKATRNQVSASTLFSGTLYCSYCGAELKLIRSAGKYRQLGCLNGYKRLHGCQLSASKSVRVVEECLLKFLSEQLLSDTRVEELVVRANELSGDEAARPLIETVSVKAQLNKLKAQRDRLVRVVSETDDAEVSAVYRGKIVQLQKEMGPLQDRIRESELPNKRKLKPLTVKQARKYLVNLKAVLDQDVGPAAEAIRQLTGLIKISQMPIEGKKRYRWIANFSPDLIRAILFANSTITESFPFSTGSDSPEIFEVVIEDVPAYESLAPKFKALRDGGASIPTIANAHGMTNQQVEQSLRFAETGERPKFKSGKRTGTGGNQQKYRSIAPQVVALRDRERRSFKKIAKELQVNESTVRRAYDYAKPSGVQNAAANGRRPDRGKYVHMEGKRYKKLVALLKKGKDAKQVAKGVGCSVETVSRIGKDLNQSPTL